MAGARARLELKLARWEFLAGSKERAGSAAGRSHQDRGGTSVSPPRVPTPCPHAVSPRRAQQVRLSPGAAGLGDALEVPCTPSGVTAQQPRHQISRLGGLSKTSPRHPKSQVATPVGPLCGWAAVPWPGGSCGSQPCHPLRCPPVPLSPSAPPARRHSCPRPPSPRPRCSGTCPPRPPSARRPRRPRP